MTQAQGTAAFGPPLISVIILAAGMGTRLGGPKVRLRVAGGQSLLATQVSAIEAALRVGGRPAEILIVVGAGIPGIDSTIEPERIASQLDGADGTAMDLGDADDIDGRLGDHLPDAPPNVRIVANPDFASGMGSSVEAGLRATSAESTAAVITLLDLPNIPAAIYPRLAVLAAPGILARCTWGGKPGHPVLIGRNRIAEAIAACRADSGAKALFRDHADIVTEVEGGDLVTDGSDPRRDVDMAFDAAARGLVLGPLRRILA